jgi:hypothetical protein
MEEADDFHCSEIIELRFQEVGIPALYSEGPGFKSRSGDRLFSDFFVFLSFSRKILR